MLLEVAVGDAGFEYADPDFMLAHNTLRGYVQHPTHLDVRPGAYTDDTQMTIAVAEVLVSGQPWTASVPADEFVRAFPPGSPRGLRRRPPRAAASAAGLCGVQR
jgi:ADP-ribosylglycohydrolase